ncbi:MAG: 5-formyltetrahydrofolate cyclo-ligase [Candidatus Bathyarchaeota archaeon]|nr:5-formyltetrahydrofolate cyclo-ligase [Candidatus Bathyarchaeota archaeon]
MDDVVLEKDHIRRRIWELMEQSGVARFPRPVFGRIPNFEGSEKAARRLSEQSVFRSAKVVKVNPDAPQRKVRMSVLSSGKILIMPTPRLRKGFIILDPREIPERFLAKASTIRGAFSYGRLCSLKDLPKVDLVVAGSVAVSRDGVRIGKGGGYSELEYGFLRELDLVREDTPVLTTVHDIQIVDKVPREAQDLVVDAIITPTRTIRIKRRSSRLKGIIWELITENKLDDMPVLLELRRLTGN